MTDPWIEPDGPGDELAQWEQALLAEQFEIDRRSAAVERAHLWQAWAWGVALVILAVVLGRWPDLRIYLGSTAYPAYYVGKHVGWLRRHRKGPTS